MTYTSLIQQVAETEGVDYHLLLAICTVESSLNPLAVRYEPGWKYFYYQREFAEKNQISVATESALQACSYGLCQVMGSVMRERGFEGPLAQCFIDPALPLKHGARHLKGFLGRYGTESDAISAYNQGSPRKTTGGMYVNQRYVDKVSLILRQLRASPGE